MHIPDGFLSSNTWIPAWLLSAGGVGFCLKKTSAILKERMIPLMGVMSAFIFAAQMINFPVFGGTSGHLFGGVLAALLLGPYAGSVVLTCVVIFQCLVFQDGGLLALGANTLQYGNSRNAWRLSHLQSDRQNEPWEDWNHDRDSRGILVFCRDRCLFLFHGDRHLRDLSHAD